MKKKNIWIIIILVAIIICLAAALVYMIFKNGNPLPPDSVITKEAEEVHEMSSPPTIIASQMIYTQKQLISWFQTLEHSYNETASFTEPDGYSQECFASISKALEHPKVYRAIHKLNKKSYGIAFISLGMDLLVTEKVEQIIPHVITGPDDLDISVKYTSDTSSFNISTITFNLPENRFYSEEFLQTVVFEVIYRLPSGNLERCFFAMKFTR